MSIFTFHTTIERGDDEIEVRVTYGVTPFIAQTYWQPAEGGEVELIRAEFIGREVGSIADFTEAEEEKVHAECEARARDDMEAEAAEEADYRYDQYRDRQMMDAWEQGV